MAAALSHRGPDDRGLWVTKMAVAAFGHQRLAVVDLEPGGSSTDDVCGREVGTLVQR